jgi:hypothetical protein
MKLSQALRRIFCLADDTVDTTYEKIGKIKGNRIRVLPASRGASVSSVDEGTLPKLPIQKFSKTELLPISEESTPLDLSKTSIKKADFSVDQAKLDAFLSQNSLKPVTKTGALIGGFSTVGPAYDIEAHLHSKPVSVRLDRTVVVEKIVEIEKPVPVLIERQSQSRQSARSNKSSAQSPSRPRWNFSTKVDVKTSLLQKHIAYEAKAANEIRLERQAEAQRRRQATHPTIPKKVVPLKVVDIAENIIFDRSNAN